MTGRLRGETRHLARCRSQRGTDDEERFHAAAQAGRHRGTVRSNAPLFATRHDLPIMLGSFIGREHEQAEVLRFVLEEGIRLVSSPVQGGVGKTRLAVEVASQLGVHFQDGVVFVSLAPVSDPGLVPAAIARALDVHEIRNIPLCKGSRFTSEDVPP